MTELPRTHRHIRAAARGFVVLVLVWVTLSCGRAAEPGHDDASDQPPAPAPGRVEAAESIPRAVADQAEAPGTVPQAPVPTSASDLPPEVAVPQAPTPAPASDLPPEAAVPRPPAAPAGPPATPTQTPAASSLQEQREALFRQLRDVHSPSDAEMARLREIFAGSRYIGQGNPAVTRHRATPAECRARLGESGVSYENPRFERICGGKYMAPLHDPSTQEPEDATACIDAFEFPNIPCAYPVVWVRAREAAQICAAVGKRLCDAHEWEGGCAGALLEPDYRFELAAGVDPSTGFNRMRAAHNRTWEPRKTWAYGPERRTGVCAMAGFKSPQCGGGSWTDCGSNTYPTGMFPECRSPLGVYDQHGNAAEHMNLPLAPDQMASRDSATLGYTEMKGSWFIFDRYYAHEDWCRWRAPYWHGSRVMAADSHHNYHLGFRCCKSLSGGDAGPEANPAALLAGPEPGE